MLDFVNSGLKEQQIMSFDVRVDFEVTDIYNKSVIAPSSTWLGSYHESFLERELEYGDYLDYPIITDLLRRAEAELAASRRGCDASGCFDWKKDVRATSYIVIYKLHRVGNKHYKVRGFCVCGCDKHEYIVREFDWDWSKAEFQCKTCSCDFFSSRLRILNRNFSTCHACRRATRKA